MAFLPDGRLLVHGAARGVEAAFAGSRAVRRRRRSAAVEYAGQGGLGDVALHPDFASNGVVYLSIAEPGERGTAGAAVARAQLVQAEGRASLDGLSVIWRQTPKVSGRGHYGHRIAFGPDGFLYISSASAKISRPRRICSKTSGKIVR
jgi:glucose/arabinose dehydrogenase